MNPRMQKLSVKNTMATCSMHIIHVCTCNSRLSIWYIMFFMHMAGTKVGYSIQIPQGTFKTLLFSPCVPHSLMQGSGNSMVYDIFSCIWHGSQLHVWCTNSYKKFWNPF